MKILLAVSGGIDSMYLAERAGDLFPGGSFAVAHCNFRLRGTESDGDEVFVRDWCAAHGMPLYVQAFDTLSSAAEKGISPEMAARDLRYGWFAQLCAQEGYDAVAVAHNADDDAETMLLHLLHGTGTRGLRGMAAESVIPIPGCTVPLLRPLLGTTRAGIHAWMTAAGKAWREDSTNTDCGIPRNRLRHRVFPELAAINPSFLDTLRRDRAHIAQADAIAEEYYRSALPALCDGEGRIDIVKLLSFRHWRYLLYRLTEGPGMDEATLERLCGLLASGSFSGTRKFGDWILSRGALEPVSANLPAPAVSWEVLPREAVPAIRQPAGTLILDAARFDGAPVIRPWQAGDWMVPLGMTGRKKLSDLFADLKFSAADKARARVVEYPGTADGPASASGGRGRRVAALAGWRIDDSLKVTGDTDRILKITLE